MKYIFLHGLGQGYQMWNPVLSYLGKNYDVESLDLYEWFSGKQISWLGLYSSFEAYCNNVEEPIVLCGLSLGGRSYISDKSGSPSCIEKTNKE